MMVRAQSKKNAPKIYTFRCMALWLILASLFICARLKWPTSKVNKSRSHIMYRSSECEYVRAPLIVSSQTPPSRCVIYSGHETKYTKTRSRLLSHDHDVIIKHAQMTRSKCQRLTECFHEQRDLLKSIADRRVAKTGKSSIF